MVGVSVFVRVGVNVFVGSGVFVRVGVNVFVGSGVMVGVGVNVLVGSGEGVLVGVLLGVKVRVGVGVRVTHTSFSLMMQGRVGVAAMATLTVGSSTVGVPVGGAPAPTMIWSKLTNVSPLAARFLPVTRKEMVCALSGATL